MGGTVREVQGKDVIDTILLGASGVSFKRCIALRKTLNIRTIDDLMNCSVEDFKQLDGIGEKVANNIYEWVHNIKGN